MRRSDYVIKRTGFALVTIFVAITLNFVLFRVAPRRRRLQPVERPRTPRRSCGTRSTREFGLDKSKWEQYLIYLRQLAHGNLGVSFANQQPVGQPAQRSGEHDPDGGPRAR